MASTKTNGYEFITPYLLSTTQDRLNQCLRRQSMSLCCKNPNSFLKFSKGNIVFVERNLEINCSRAASYDNYKYTLPAFKDVEQWFSSEIVFTIPQGPPIMKTTTSVFLKIIKQITIYLNTNVDCKKRHPPV